MSFLVMFVVSLAISVAVYMLTPQPKAPNVESKDLQAPTVSAGRPMPVTFGTVTIKSPNVLWYGEKVKKEYEVNA